MRYVYIRLFLSEIEHPPLLDKMLEGREQDDRTDHLIHAFSKRWDFNHRGSQLIYLPVDKESDDGITFCFGRIGKQVVDHVNEGPERLFEKKQQTSWRASNLVLNTGSDPDGQKLAIQERGDIGKPLAIVNSLVQHINAELEKSGWVITANVISEKSTFWEATEKYKGQITKAEFSYVTPNILGIRSQLNKRLKDYRERENAQLVTVTIQEPKGHLRFDTEEVQDAIEYISEGGGSVKLKAGKEKIFDSKDSAKAKDAESDDSTAIDDKNGRQGLIKRFFK